MLGSLLSAIDRTNYAVTHNPYDHDLGYPNA